VRIVLAPPPWRWRQYVAPKQWQIYTKLLHHVISLKKIIFLKNSQCTKDKWGSLKRKYRSSLQKKSSCILKIQLQLKNKRLNIQVFWDVMPCQLVMGKIVVRISKYCKGKIQWALLPVHLHIYNSLQNYYNVATFIMCCCFKICCYKYIY
jgi:hypothetical protein